MAECHPYSASAFFEMGGVADFFAAGFFGFTFADLVADSESAKPNNEESGALSLTPPV